MEGAEKNFFLLSDIWHRIYCEKKKIFFNLEVQFHDEGARYFELFYLTGSLCSPCNILSPSELHFYLFERFSKIWTNFALLSFLCKIGVTLCTNYAVFLVAGFEMRRKWTSNLTLSYVSKSQRAVLNL